jgi:hypothetical protein
MPPRATAPLGVDSQGSSGDCETPSPLDLRGDEANPGRRLAHGTFVNAKPTAGPCGEDRPRLLCRAPLTGGEYLRCRRKPAARAVHVRAMRCESDGVRLQLGHDQQCAPGVGL